MLLSAVNATGGFQPETPWAFYEYLRQEDIQYAYGRTLLLTGFYLVPSNTAAVSYKPENVIRGPLSILGFPEIGNISAFTSDLLDWEAGVATAPQRPSGKISVTLHYAGRGTPRPLEDY